MRFKAFLSIQRRSKWSGSMEVSQATKAIWIFVTA